MQEFLTIIFSYPVVILTVPLIGCVFYWSLTLLGIFDIEMFDPDIDIDADAGGDGDADETNGGIIAVIIKALGLVGAPVTISFSSWIVSAWMALFAGTKYFVYGFFTGLMSVFIGIGVIIVALIIGLLITQRFVKVLRPAFKQHLAAKKSDLIGLVGTITTNKVTNKFGQGEFDDGGAGLILQIRSEVDQDLHRGDRVVTVDYDKKFDIYHVVREAELVA